MTTTCNRCNKPKLPYEMRAGKLHCKECRNIEQNAERQQRMERMRAAGEALPRTHVNTDPYQPALEPTYYRNDGLKHILSRGMPT